MPLYRVSLVATLEVGAAFTLTARDDAEADRLADLLADKVSLKWDVALTPGPALEWREIDQTASVDSVEDCRLYDPKEVE